MLIISGCLGKIMSCLGIYNPNPLYSGFISALAWVVKSPQGFTFAHIPRKAARKLII